MYISKQDITIFKFIRHDFALNRIWFLVSTKLDIKHFWMNLTVSLKMGIFQQVLNYENFCMDKMTLRMRLTLTTLRMCPSYCLTLCLSCWSKLSKVREASFLESREQTSRQKGRPQHRRRHGRRRESGGRSC